MTPGTAWDWGGGTVDGQEGLVPKPHGLGVSMSCLALSYCPGGS